MKLLSLLPHNSAPLYVTSCDAQAWLSCRKLMNKLDKQQSLLIGLDESACGLINVPLTQNQLHKIHRKIHGCDSVQTLYALSTLAFECKIFHRCHNTCKLDCELSYESEGKLEF